MQAAIVTGVSRGLGEALAAAMLARGFTVLGVGRTASAKLKGKHYHHAACDLAQPALIAASVTPALRTLAAHKPDAVTLINNAAVATPTGLLGHLDAADIEAALLINAAAPVVMADLFCRTFADDAIERRIINISSGAAQTAIAGSATYSMSKAALEMLTRSIAAEQSAPRFRCISVRPGIFETGMQAYMRSRDPAEFPSVGMFRGFKENGLLKDPAEVAARIVDKLVLGPVEHGRTYSHTEL
jgi:NAD(P)-dependent dehydrogenase (short-subunit alcohol dehydrogenase family)